MSMKLVIRSAAVFVALTGLASGVSANQLGVSAAVPDACTVVAGTLPFGTYDPAAQASNSLAGSGTFDVTCTLASSVNVLMDAGANFSGGTRKLLSTSTTDTLDYSLYQDGGFSTEWGDDGSTISQASQQFPTLGAVTTNISVHGLIPQGQTVRGGTYQDTVNISLVFN